MFKIRDNKRLKLRRASSDKLQVRQPHLHTRKPKLQDADLSNFTEYQESLGGFPGGLVVKDLPANAGDTR